MTDKLFCPFCGGDVRLQLTDSEGNWHNEDYLQEPYSGIGYVLVHTESGNASKCPIATHDDESLGKIIFDSKEEAIKSWNYRADRKEKDI